MSSSPSPSSSALTPTTRSRTLLFVSYRDSTARTSRTRKNPFLPASNNYTDSDAFHADDEQDHLISHADDPSGHIALDVDVELPPKWVDISDQVHDILAATQSKISALERLHAKHVLPGFADRSAEEREIEAVTTDITRDFRRCQSLIQSISAAAASQQQHHHFPPRSQAQTQHERLAAQNVQRGLAAKVQEISATFRKKQRVYLETLQGHAIKNQDLLVASGAVTLKGSEGISDLDEDLRVAARNHNSSLLSQQQQQELDSSDVDIDLQTRDREITEIARSIGALAELFKDLSTLVIDQGTLLDSVEYNIEQTSAHMVEAVTELHLAEGYQKNTGRRKCIFLLLLIIFGLVVVLIFKPRRHAPLPPPVPAPGAAAAKAGEQGEEQLPPLPIDVTTLDPEVLGFGEGESVGNVVRERGPRNVRRRRRRVDVIRDTVDEDSWDATRALVPRLDRTRMRTRPRRQPYAYPIPYAYLGG